MQRTYRPVCYKSWLKVRAIETEAKAATEKDFKANGWYNQAHMQLSYHRPTTSSKYGLQEKCRLYK